MEGLISEAMAAAALVDIIEGDAYGYCQADRGSPTQISIDVDGAPIGVVLADEAVAGRLGSRLPAGALGWRIPVPDHLRDGKTHRFSIEMRQADVLVFHCEQPAFVPLLAWKGYLDAVERDHLRGWVKLRDDDGARLRLGLRVDGEIVATTRADIHRQDVQDHGFGDGAYGFRLELPIPIRLVGAMAEIVLLDDDGGAQILFHASVARTDARILIVTDTGDEADASRYYRAFLQSRLLWRSGAEVAVIDRSQFDATQLAGFDLIIIQRAPADAAMIGRLSHAVRDWKVVFYETDDLNISSELIAGTGSVRSGFRDPSDPRFIAEIEGRAASATFSFATIVPNRFMKRWFEARGFRTLLSPSFVERRFVRRERRSRPDRGWRVLYLSGSPTHRMDFDVAAIGLREFVNAHPDVRLEVLGHVDALQLVGFRRTSHHAAVPYAEMLDIIGGVDLVVAPYEKTVFNFAKSAVKFLEAGAVGVPVMASPVPDYRWHIARSGFGYVLPWGGDWFAGLAKAYEERDEVRERSADLCEYVRAFSAEVGGSNALFEGLAGIHQGAMCGLDLPVPAAGGGGPVPLVRAKLEHDPEKWTPVFRKDHARTRR